MLTLVCQRLGCCSNMPRVCHGTRLVLIYLYNSLFLRLSASLKYPKICYIQLIALLQGAHVFIFSIRNLYISYVGLEELLGYILYDVEAKLIASLRLASALLKLDTGKVLCLKPCHTRTTK